MLCCMAWKIESSVEKDGLAVEVHPSPPPSAVLVSAKKSAGFDAICCMVEHAEIPDESVVQVLEEPVAIEEP